MTQDEKRLGWARAAQELTAAVTVLNQANALFGILEKTAAGSDPAEVFLIAQIGAELTANYGERAAAEADFFAGVRHGQ
jgi:Fic family protein